MGGNFAIEHVVECFERLRRRAADTYDGVIDIVEVAQNGEPRTVYQTVERRTVPNVGPVQVVKLLLLQFERPGVLGVKIRQMFFQFPGAFHAPAVIVIHDHIQTIAELDHCRLHAKLSRFIHHATIFPITTMEKRHQRLNGTENRADLQIGNLLPARYGNRFVHTFILPKWSLAHFQSHVASTASSFTGHPLNTAISGST